LERRLHAFDRARGMACHFGSDLAAALISLLPPTLET